MESIMVRWLKVAPKLSDTPQSVEPQKITQPPSSCSLALPCLQIKIAEIQNQPPPRRDVRDLGTMFLNATMVPAAVTDELADLSG